MELIVKKYGPSISYEVEVFSDSDTKVGILKFVNIHDDTPFLFHMCNHDDEHLEYLADTCGVTVEELYIKAHEAIEDYNVSNKMPNNGDTVIMADERGIMCIECLEYGKDEKGWYIKAGSGNTYYLDGINKVLTFFNEYNNEFKLYDLVKHEDGNIGKIMRINNDTVDVQWLHQKEKKDSRRHRIYTFESDVDPHKLTLIYSSQYKLV